MKIWCISDSHNYHQYFKIPKVDMAIFCGDGASSRNTGINANEAKNFLDWYSDVDIPTKIFVPGNHSKAIEAGYFKPEDYPDLIWLINQEYVHDLSYSYCHWDNMNPPCDGRTFYVEKKIKIWGSPNTPTYGHDWAYMSNRGKIHRYWDAIPYDTDILITHGPPRGIGDLTVRKDGVMLQDGCRNLRKQIHKRIKPKIHAYGHFHDNKTEEINNYGVRRVAGCDTVFVNCACHVFGSDSINNGIVINYETLEIVSL